MRRSPDQPVKQAGNNDRLLVPLQPAARLSVRNARFAFARAIAIVDAFTQS